MNLTNEQIEAVKQWVGQGADIADVQKRLSQQFGVSMTYMDVRFLIDDIGATLEDKPEPKVEAPAAEAPSAEVEPQAPQGQSPEESQDAADAGEPQGESSVKVSLSPIQRPGFFASGDVVFSDGVRAEWAVDQMGRLSLSPSQEGYKPSQQDIIEFQTQLQKLFR